MSIPDLESFLAKRNAPCDGSGEVVCDFTMTLTMFCDDCGKQLNCRNIEHGLEDFGHYHRCCFCYDRRQRGLEPFCKLSLADREALSAARRLAASND